MSKPSHRHSGSRHMPAQARARAYYDCLTYLEREAKEDQLGELAHLIGVAAAAAEEMTRVLRYDA